jgi:excisionase family DNA binding protein
MTAATSTHLLTQSVREEQSDLFDVNAVARKLGCSTRHVRRMADGGLMPPPIKLGALVRWRRQDLDTWIAGGCKPVRAADKGDRQ